MTDRTVWTLSEAALRRIHSRVVESEPNDCSIGDTIREALRAENYNDPDDWRALLLYWREHAHNFLLYCAAACENRETRNLRKATRAAVAAAKALQYEQHRCQPTIVPNPYGGEDQ